MSTKNSSEQNIAPPPDESMNIRALTELLIRHFGHRDGLFDLVIQFQIGAGAFGPSKDDVLPSAIVGVSGVGLKQVEKPGANSVDAAIVNPAQKQKRTKRSSKS